MAYDLWTWIYKFIISNDQTQSPCGDCLWAEGYGREGHDIDGYMYLPADQKRWEEENMDDLCAIIEEWNIKDLSLCPPSLIQVKTKTKRLWEASATFISSNWKISTWGTTDSSRSRCFRVCLSSNAYGLVVLKLARLELNSEHFNFEKIPFSLHARPLPCPKQHSIGGWTHPNEFT